jgi:hypothetical protein
MQVRHCKNGVVEFSLNAEELANSIGSQLQDYIYDPDTKMRFLTLRLPYYFSVLQYLGSDANFPQDDFCEYYEEFFHTVISKEFEDCTSKEDDRYRMADEFTMLIESTTGLPSKYLDLWQLAKKKVNG